MRVVWILQHHDAETPGLIQTVLQRQDLLLITLRPDQKPLPEKLTEDCSALVVMGGPMSVYDTERNPWIAVELGLIREAVASARPVLAMCLGSQLLAAAGGADVFPADGPKEIGWRMIKLSDLGRQDPLSKFLANPATEERTTVFQWHGDTFGLPPGATLLASSLRCPQQAFRLGRAAYGFQFHFEVTEQMIRHWVELWKQDLAAGETSSDEIFAGLKEHLPLLNRRGEEVVRAFAALIHASPVRAMPESDGEGQLRSAARRRRIASMAEINALLPPSEEEVKEEERMQRLDRLHGLRRQEEAEEADLQSSQAQEDRPPPTAPSETRPPIRDRLAGIRRSASAPVPESDGEGGRAGHPAAAHNEKNPV